MPAQTSAQMQPLKHQTQKQTFGKNEQEYDTVTDLI